MSKRKYTSGVLSVGVGFVDGNPNGAFCFTINIRLSDEDEHPERCVRDIIRAARTFELHADLENEDVFVPGIKAFGPFLLPGGKEVFAFVTFQVFQESVGDISLHRVRSGVDGAAALLRQSGYSVRRKYKDIEQLMIPGVDQQIGLPDKPNDDDDDDDGADQ
jgi:hypothetical protein